MHTAATIAELIDQSPMNRGMSGAAWIADVNNIAVADGEDVILFENEGQGKFQFHWLKSSKGRSAIEYAKAALAHMFDARNAKVIYGVVPVASRATRLMARFIGAKPFGETLTPDGPCQIFIMTREIREGNN